LVEHALHGSESPTLLLELLTELLVVLEQPTSLLALLLPRVVPGLAVVGVANFVGVVEIVIIIEIIEIVVVDVVVVVVDIGLRLVATRRRVPFVQSGLVFSLDL
jgi:hypothetical protein